MHFQMENFENGKEWENGELDQKRHLAPVASKSFRNDFNSKSPQMHC